MYDRSVRYVTATTLQKLCVITYNLNKALLKYKLYCLSSAPLLG